jgi:hypothetical protein
LISFSCAVDVLTENITTRQMKIKNFNPSIVLLLI